MELKKVSRIKGPSRRMIRQMVYTGGVVKGNLIPVSSRPVFNEDLDYTMNRRAEWVPAIPPAHRVYHLPIQQCPKCMREFLTTRGYQGHYALEHILLL